MKPAVFLHQAKERTILRGHPWIFPKAILRQTNNVKTGELVEVFGSNGNVLGVGVYNEHSLYRVRILAYAFESMSAFNIGSLVTFRLQQALLLRQSIHLPNSSTTAYRLCNSEGDGLSGLTIDCFNEVCVVSSSAYWVELNKEIITQCIREVIKPREIIWLAQPKPLAQDGWKKPIEVGNFGFEEVLEAGVIYHVDFNQTQKTGLFLDQRENHQRIGDLAKGKRVLDLYTYTGGFALHAAKGGALMVTAIDSSAQAIELAKKNALLNQEERINFIKADARDYLSKAGEYDLIVLDPPKLVPSQRDLKKAKNYYRYLHREVFNNMQSGSLLLTCNCSSALSSDEFANLVSHQAVATGKVARILGVFGPSSCHPVLTSFPEGHYLTAILLAVV